MQDETKRIADEAASLLREAKTREEIEAVRVRFFGRKGQISLLLGQLGKIAPGERKAAGAAINAVKAELDSAIAEANAGLRRATVDAELREGAIDVTLPGRARFQGHRHPISQALAAVRSIFEKMGFEVIDGPEIETDFYNFEALNFAPDHPARDMQDTFVIDPTTLGSTGAKGPVVLRTHTSPVQIRAMLRSKPPLRVIAPGRVYRRDSDQTHSPMFTQVEGLYVDRGVTFSELKGTLSAFSAALFGSRTKTRFRPSFFPFTEPSAEVDVSCVFCTGTGCRVCKGTGWLEILGSGMVHPNVLRGCGYDSSDIRGFAFGLGIERVAMLLFDIEDIRNLFENDHRFIAQF